MDWLLFFHNFFDIISTYAGLLGLSVQAGIIYVKRLLRKKKRKEKTDNQ